MFGRNERIRPALNHPRRRLFPLSFSSSSGLEYLYLDLCALLVFIFAWTFRSSLGEAFAALCGAWMLLLGS